MLFSLVTSCVAFCLLCLFLGCCLRFAVCCIIYLQRRLKNRKVETEVIIGEILKPSKSSPSYRLFGFVVHRGQHQGSHYVSVMCMADN